MVASGLLPAFGVNHASVTNAFNLADDMVEPFRPFVDVLVRKSIDVDARSLDLHVDAASPLQEIQRLSGGLPAKRAAHVHRRRARDTR